MGFIMDGLDAEAYDRSYGDRELVRRIVGYFRPRVRTMLLVALMVLLQSVFDTGTPILISRGVNALEGNPSLQLLLLLAGGALTFGVLSWVCNFVRQSSSARAVGDVVLALRRDAFAAVTARDMSFYDQYASGKIVSRVTSDTEDFATVVTLVMDLLSQVLVVVIITGVLLYINWRLALIALLVAPIVFVVALAYRSISRRNLQRAQRMRANVNSIIQETVSGIAVAKGFRQERAIYDDFSVTNRGAFRVLLISGLTLGTIFPILGTLGGIAVAAVVYFGGLQVVAGSVSLGDWYLFVQSLALFLFPLTSIASFWSQFQQGLAASERVFALIDAEPRVVQHPTPDQPDWARLRGEIEFRHMFFSYSADEAQSAERRAQSVEQTTQRRAQSAERRAQSDGGTGTSTNNAQEVASEQVLQPSAFSLQPSWVLPDFSLRIPAGQTLAVVGHTGAGKSSLARLLARFYEFQGGEILIDGRDIRSLDLQAYRRRLGIVPQVPFLFNGTVADNIRYGRPDAPLEEVAATAQRIGGGEWVDDLPEGLATNVGERGARLSLGQRQLVALARLLFQDPAICILDEATASIDPFTEEQIQEGLDVVLNQRTSIVIAHRLSTVRNADRIIVLRQGQIIEEGTHDVLMAQGGHYAELYNTYFRHQSLEYIEQVGRQQVATD